MKGRKVGKIQKKKRKLKPFKRWAEPEGGPFERQRAFLEERFAPLRRKDAKEKKGEKKRAVPTRPEEKPVSPLPANFRIKLVRQYRQRQREQLKKRATKPAETRDKEQKGTASNDPIKTSRRGSMRARLATTPQPPEAPQPPPANNWIPIGPSVLRQGQGGTKPATSGRTPGIAVAPGGNRVYIAAANGGVWRSEDIGQTWRSLMEAFDLNPNNQASDSLACGAIALVPGAVASQDRIYVGTGEGHSSLDCYFGVGPVVSTDGGANWITEPVAPGSAQLAGNGFYALAVDPANTDRVVAATNQGVYRREPDGSGGFHWAQKTLGGIANQIVTSAVVASSGGVTTFYAARRSGPVYSSTDGHTWTQLGAGFPTTGFGRVSLAVQENNPNVVYAFLSNGNIYRLDVSDGTWRQITGVPASGNLVGTQGWYDLAIAVAPNNVNRIYLGGSTVWSGGDWSGALYRCEVTVSGTSVSMTYTHIGNSVHADIHIIVFAPGDPNKLWVGCDGGVFYSTNPTGSGDIFEERNTGLATLTMNYLGQHPTEDAVLFCGTQDNGGERFTGEEAWLYSDGGDCGYYVVNWNDPYKVLDTYTGAAIRRSTDGGTRYSSTWVNLTDTSDLVLFYAPLEGTPPNPSTPAEAERVAFGTSRPWISDTFGGNWYSIPNNNTNDRLGTTGAFCIRALAFASYNRLYAATMNGQVYRYDLSGTTWTRTRIDNVGGANFLPLAGPITDIAIDHADPTGDSIYITFGGTGDWRHIWHFDGSQWQPRSGPSAGHANSLLNVQHNAIVVDPANTSHIYAGADIGIWQSLDGGLNWQPFSEGLPDASVIDLKLHAGRRLLRASTHGRGVFERTLDTGSKLGVELYVRDTQLDQGRFTTVNWLPDPTKKGEMVRHYRGPDIKLDTPDVNGNYQFPLTGTIDFLQFVDTLTDDFLNVATHATATITTRVYVQVHNRGVLPADNVRVMLLLTPAAGGLPALPTGYASNVQNGTPIETADWTTVGITTLNDVRVGFPKIAAFDLTSDKLPPPANLAGNEHQCVVALIHHADDPYTSTITNTDANSLENRKAAHKNLTVVQFTGTLPTQPPLVIPIRVNNAYVNKEMRTALNLDLRGYRGRVFICMPPLKAVGGLIGQKPTIWSKGFEDIFIEEDFSDFNTWGRKHIKMIKRNQSTRHAYHKLWAQQRIRDVEQAMDHGLMLGIKSRRKVLRSPTITLEPNRHYTIFLIVYRPTRSNTGQAFEIEVQQEDQEQLRKMGGLSIRVELVR